MTTDLEQRLRDAKSFAEFRDLIVNSKPRLFIEDLTPIMGRLPRDVAGVRFGATIALQELADSILLADGTLARIEALAKTDAHHLVVRTALDMLLAMPGEDDKNDDLATLESALGPTNTTGQAMLAVAESDLEDDVVKTFLELCAMAFETALQVALGASATEARERALQVGMLACLELGASPADVERAVLAVQAVPETLSDRLAAIKEATPGFVVEAWLWLALSTCDLVLSTMGLCTPIRRRQTRRKKTVRHK